MDFKGKFEEDWLINEGEDIFLVNLSFFFRSPLSIEHTDFDSLYLKNYFEFFKRLKYLIAYIKFYKTRSTCGNQCGPLLCP